MKGRFTLGLLFVLSVNLLDAEGQQELFFLGTYTDHSTSKGIYRGTLDATSGKLGPLVLAAPAVDPSFLALAPGGETIYAAEELPGSGRLQGFSLENDDRAVPAESESSGGQGTCHVSVDSTGHDALVANYGSGSIACFRLGENGSIGKRTALISFIGSGPNAARQKSPHAHSAFFSPDDKFVYACDLGSDRIWSFKFDRLTESLVANDPPSIQTPPGSGPRHLVFGRDGRFVYVSNEMGHSVTAFSRDLVTGNLTTLETVSVITSTVSPSGVTTAEIVLHPSERWLYVSNRGCDTLSVLAVNSSGDLKLVQSIAAGVNSPRSCAIDPTGDWLIAAGQQDNRIAVLKIDSLTGQLSSASDSAKVGSPVCVLFENKR